MSQNPQIRNPIGSAKGMFGTMEECQQEFLFRW